MATSYSNLAQAQAAYDTVRKQLERAQRNAHIAEQQAIMGVNNYLKQNGYTGGAAESILLRTRSRPGDYSAYDAQLADLAAIIKGFRNTNRGIGRGGAVSKVVGSTAPTNYAAYNVGNSSTPTMASAKSKVARGVASPSYPSMASAKSKVAGGVASPSYPSMASAKSKVAGGVASYLKRK